MASILTRLPRVSGMRSTVDWSERLEAMAAQFRGLNPNQPGQWPFLPRLTAWCGAALVSLFVMWLLVLSTAHEQLQAEQEREPTLRQDFRLKLSQAANLNELRKQKLQVQEFVTQLERQLPGKAEMDALLSDINQAGVGRGLMFELFRPGQIDVKDYYAQLPIALRVSGRYHDIGAFASDIANLSRIVTLHNLVITSTPSKDGSPMLAMEATAHTYRYLDPNEIAEVKKQAREKAAKGVRR